MNEPPLRIVGLCKAFGALTVSRTISLDLRRGEIHALIGPNGAGKSTLIGQISGWLPPDSGVIRLNGIDVTQKSVAERARLGLGRSFQVSSLALEFSARRNVMLAILGRKGTWFGFRKSVNRDRALIDDAERALRRVGFEDRQNLPVSELSHGQRRQVEIACAIALRPVCYLLDEPMAGLDPAGSAHLTDFLEDLKQEAPILLVEHDMDAVFRLADRISVLVDGEIIETGTAAQISASRAVQTAYLGSGFDAAR